MKNYKIIPKKLGNTKSILTEIMSGGIIKTSNTSDEFEANII